MLWTVDRVVTGTIAVVCILVLIFLWVAAISKGGACFVPVGALTLLGSAMWRSYMKIERGRRTVTRKDEVVLEIAKGSRKGAFALYLRPFFSSGGMALPGGAPESWSSGRLVLAIDLEQVLEDALALPLVKVGAAESNLGCGSVEVNDVELPASVRGLIESADRLDGAKWQVVVRSLIERAEVVVLLPADRPGTLWEVDLILADPGFLNKTIFLMPPDIEQAIWRPEWRQQWKQVRQRFLDRGINVPGYTPAGMFFRLDADRKYRRWAMIDEHTPKGVRTALCRVGKPVRSAWPKGTSEVFIPGVDPAALQIRQITDSDGSPPRD